MRLRQLARKLDVRPSEIIEFLAHRNISIEEDSNTRLEDFQVSLIMRHFAPGDDGALAAAIAENQIEDSELSAPQQVSEQANTGFSPTPVPPGAEEKPEVIKATKVELTGLKVLGKIDLPEPRKKIPVAPEPPEDNTHITDQPRERRSAHQSKNKNDERQRKNPIAQQREREMKAAEQQKIAEARKAKELRTQNYLSKVKVSAPTKRIKLVEEPLEISEGPAPAAPRTWFGKIAKWLTT